jgi:hypothetical protein
MADCSGSTDVFACMCQIAGETVVLDLVVKLGFIAEDHPAQHGEVTNPIFNHSELPPSIYRPSRLFKLPTHTNMEIQHSVL